MDNIVMSDYMTRYSCLGCVWYDSGIDTFGDEFAGCEHDEGAEYWIEQGEDVDCADDCKYYEEDLGIQEDN